MNNFTKQTNRSNPYVSSKNTHNKEVSEQKKFQTSKTIIMCENIFNLAKKIKKFNYRKIMRGRHENLEKS
jgi:hypothetical protein